MSGTLVAGAAPIKAAGFRDELDRRRLDRFSETHEKLRSGHG